jgi:flagellar biosynthesis protein FlhG
MQSFLATPPQEQRDPQDQARELRSLVARRALENDNRRSTKPHCHTIVVGGGKGGVGRSVIATNLAIAMAKRGSNVGLLDASPDLGSIEMLCGLNGYWNLSHVAQGCRQLSHVMQTGPERVRILSGGCCLLECDSNSNRVQNNLIQPLIEFERELDWLIVDASCGSGSNLQQFAMTADDVVIVTTPEPTAVAEAFASVKSLAKLSQPRLGLLVNQADSSAQAQRILDRLQQSARTFLNRDLHRRGYIPRDGRVACSVNNRSPFVVASPECEAAIALEQLSQRWTRTTCFESETFFETLINSHGRDDFAENRSGYDVRGK